MNKTKLLSIAVVGLVLINILTLTFMFLKSPQHPMDMRDGEGPKKIIIERLGFDAAQQEKYSLLVNEHRVKMRELNRASMEMHDKLYSQLNNVNIDTALADSIIQSIAKNQTALDQLNFEHFQKIKALCTNEQLPRFNLLLTDLTHLFGPHGKPPK